VSCSAFIELPDSQRFGIMPNGKILASPCKSFYLQLVEPVPDLVGRRVHRDLQRIGLGTPSVPAAVAALRARGVEFLESGKVHSNEPWRADPALDGQRDVRTRARRRVEGGDQQGTDR